MSQDIKCSNCCKKKVAIPRDGKVFVWCSHCKKEIELELEVAIKQSDIKIC